MTTPTKDPPPVFLTGLRAQNTLRLELVALEFDPEGQLVIVAGENEQGKTSLLRTVLMGLSGKDAIPQQPVRIGEERGEVDLKLHSEDGDLAVRLKVKPDRDATLVIEALADGAGKRKAKLGAPQAVLNDLLGKIGIDPLTLLRMKPDKRAEIVMQAVGVSFTKLDADKKQHYDERTIINRQTKLLQAQLESLPTVDAPTEIGQPRNPAELRAKRKEEDAREKANKKTLARVGEVRQQLEDARDRVAILSSKVETAAERNSATVDLPHIQMASAIEGHANALTSIGATLQGQREALATIVGDRLPLAELKGVIEQLSLVAKNARWAWSRATEEAKSTFAALSSELAEQNERVLTLERDLASAEAAAAAVVPADTSAIDAELDGIISWNAQVQERQSQADRAKAAEASKEAKRAEVDASQAKADGLTKLIEEIDATKKRMLGAATFPIPDLSVTGEAEEAELTYKGVRLSQVSTEQQIRVCLSIAASLNPRLRLLIIKQGNDLDRKNLLVVAKWAKEFGYCVLMERIDGVVGVDGAADAGIISIVIEAGRVAWDSRVPEVSNFKPTVTVEE